jgi:hypothetical protein
MPNTPAAAAIAELDAQHERHGKAVLAWKRANGFPDRTAFYTSDSDGRVCGVRFPDGYEFDRDRWRWEHRGGACLVPRRGTPEQRAFAKSMAEIPPRPTGKDLNAKLLGCDRLVFDGLAIVWPGLCTVRLGGKKARIVIVSGAHLRDGKPLKGLREVRASVAVKAIDAARGEEP